LLEQCNCASTLKPAQRSKTLADKKIINNIALTKRRLYEQSSDLTNNTDTSVRGKETSAPLEILKEYVEWEHLFKEDLTITALPKHKP
jgi:hypothetical protein